METPTHTRRCGAHGQCGLDS